MGDRHHHNGCDGCKFKQELCVEFEVTFDVDIEDVEVTSVRCPREDHRED